MSKYKRYLDRCLSIKDDLEFMKWLEKELERHPNLCYEEIIIRLRDIGELSVYGYLIPMEMSELQYVFYVTKQRLAQQVTQKLKGR